MPRFTPFAGIRYASPLHDPATVTAPPYDVISATERAALVGADPSNVVVIDLPVPDESGEDPYERAAATWRAWQDDGTLVADTDPTFTVYRMDSVDDDGRARRTTGVSGR